MFAGETTADPIFSVKKNVNLLNSKMLAYVMAGGGAGGSPRKQRRRVLYEVEGSYAQRSCVVYDERRRVVAEIKRKEAAGAGVAFGVDVFRLVVQPELDPAVGMAVVILLEQMFGSRRSSP